MEATIWNTWIRWEILLDSLSEAGREGVVFILLSESQARWQTVVNTIKKNSLCSWLVVRMRPL